VHKKAFTLSELALAIAILAVLVAAVVPRLTDADIAAQVAQVRSDLRSIGAALEAYHRDYRAYPPDFQFYQSYVTIGRPIPDPLLWCLTTPMPYIVSLPQEVFSNNSPIGGPHYGYMAKYFVSIVGSQYNYPYRGTDRWALVSKGPDLWSNSGHYLLFGEDILNQIPEWPAWQVGPGCLYDPTNGAVSAGDIVLLHEDMLTTTFVSNWHAYH